MEQEGAPGGTQQAWQVGKMGRKTQCGGSWGGGGMVTASLASGWD